MRIARLCSEFHVLPHAGGLFSQPYGQMLRLEAVLDARTKAEERESKKQERRSKVLNRG